MEILINGDTLSVFSEELEVLEAIDEVDIKGLGLKASKIAIEIYGYENRGRGGMKKPSGQKVSSQIKSLRDKDLIENARKKGPHKWRITDKGRRILGKVNGSDGE